MNDSLQFAPLIDCARGLNVASDEVTPPLVPHMEEIGLALYKTRIGASQVYLEYGCGGSTVYAVSVAQVPVVISVDSDIRWVNALRKELDCSSHSKLLLEHCDIGPVGEWGTPTDDRCIKDYWRYSTRPWVLAAAHNVVPDLVLIDGRFRVASFLYSLLCAREGTTILFDDYFDRPQYFVVEQFCKPTERAGRIGVFTVTKQFRPSELCARFAEFCLHSG